MKSLILTGYGDNSKLRLVEMPKPLPGTRQVLIRVSHAGINPLDFKIRSGKLRLVKKLNFPQIMGNEVSGTIVNLGAGVTKFKIGDEIFGRLHKGKMGGFAEFVIEAEENLTHKPREISHEIAAGVPLATLTAWQALRDVGNVKKGDNILIHGGGGSVGRMAIQIAKQLGSHVTTTVSDWAIDFVKELGADKVINYKTESFKDTDQRYSFILDLVGGPTLVNSFKVIEDGGKIVSIAGKLDPSIGEELKVGYLTKSLIYLSSRKVMNLAKKHNADYRFLFMRPDGQQLEKIAKLISENKLKVSIDKVYPFDRFAEAFDYQEAGQARGKVILSIDDYL